MSSSCATPSKRSHESSCAPVLRVKKLSPEAILPTRGSSLSAGFDLASAYDAVIPARGKGLVKTDLALALPAGCYARVAPRSGLAVKKFIDTGAGVIDADYRGNVGVVLFNHAAEDFEVKRGDRVAQLILEKIEYPELQEVEELDDTERGAGGFGSTGVEQSSKRQHLAVVSADKENEAPVSELDTVFRALELLQQEKVLDDKTRRQFKSSLFSTSERQFKLLSKVLGDYIQDQDASKVLEWIAAFLAAK